MRDTIERDLTIRADPETVWNSLTNPEQLCKWFCDRIEGAIEEGADIALIWGEERCLGRVITLDPPSHFAYRWTPGCNAEGTPYQESNSTLVSFYLEPAAEGTRLRLVESGFASLPAEVREKSLQENSSGWDSELQELVQLYG